jgi:hypothetical protein
MPSSVLRETLEAVRQVEGADSWTEVIAHMHFYPDLHGSLYASGHAVVVVDMRNHTGNRSPIADPRMRGSIMGLTLVSSHVQAYRHSCVRIHARLGFVSTRSRTQIRARSRGGHSSDPTHHRRAQQRGALHPRSIFVRFAGSERSAHAPTREYL